MLGERDVVAVDHSQEFYPRVSDIVWTPGDLFLTEPVDSILDRKGRAVANKSFGPGYAWEFDLVSGLGTKLELFPDYKISRFCYRDSSQDTQSRTISFDSLGVNHTEAPSSLLIIADRDWRTDIVRIFPNGDIEEHHKRIKDNKKPIPVYVPPPPNIITQSQIFVAEWGIDNTRPLFEQMDLDDVEFIFNNSGNQAPSKRKHSMSSVMAAYLEMSGKPINIATRDIVNYVIRTMSGTVQPNDQFLFDYIRLKYQLGKTGDEIAQIYGKTREHISRTAYQPSKALFLKHLTKPSDLQLGITIEQDVSE